jgi:hypothetical protein
MVKKRPSTQFVTAHSCAQRWPRRTSMPSVFTAFVRSLQGSYTPDADLFHDAWHGLRAVLAKEMKRRGLWDSPPCYLGAYGWERWDAEAPRAEPRAPGAKRRQVSALGELVADCYAFVFVDRLQSLKRHLQDKPDIDGLVLLNVRHFLHERQREHDPFGFRVFELLQAAVEEALAAGALHLLAGHGKIRNSTLLGFDPAAELPLAPSDLAPLAPIVAGWNDRLMPALVTARTRQQTAVVQQLRACLLELPRHGVEAFRFKDVLDPLKRDARARWAVLLEDEEQGSVVPSSDVPAPLPPADTVESRESFEHLTRSVSAAIERMEASRTRSQLETLWHYLWRQHGEEGEEPGRSEPNPAQAREGPPSYRQLGQRLNIPRERLPALFGLLRQLVPR